MNNQEKFSRWGGWLLGLLGVWLAGVTIASALKVFDTGSPGSMQLPLPLGLAASVPVVAFLIWFRSSRTFRGYLLSLDPAVLTAVHVWRIEGAVFIALWAVGRLPGPFALLAGIGDMTIGFTAPLVAWAFRRGKISSGAFVGWQIAGIADLVIAVATGALSSNSKFGLAAHGVTSRMMGLLPMSLIPTFGVPLMVILHLVCIAQVRAKAGAPRQTAIEGHAAV
jgi:hypothetical protein